MRERSAWWTSSGVPLRHREVVAAGLRLDSWGDPKPVQRAIETVKSNGLLVLTGPWGTGKTQLVAWLVHGVCLHLGKPSLYRRWADLISEIRSEAYGDGGSDSRPLSRLTRIGLLVIDELHERRWTDDENLWLGRILDHRYGEKKPTVLVANLTPKELRDVLSPAIADRMHQGGAVVELKGASRRGVP